LISDQTRDCCKLILCLALTGPDTSTRDGHGARLPACVAAPMGDEQAEEMPFGHTTRCCSWVLLGC
jgi:hypothetical protein